MFELTVPWYELVLRAVVVWPKVSDGALTAVEPEDPAQLPEGTEVVTAILREDEDSGTNPFAPQMGRPRGGGR